MDGSFVGQTEWCCQSAWDPRSSLWAARILRTFRSEREGCAPQWAAFLSRRRKLRPHWLVIKFGFSILLPRLRRVKGCCHDNRSHSQAAMHIVVFHMFASALLTLDATIVLFVDALGKIHSRRASSIVVEQVLFRHFVCIATLFEFNAILLSECDTNDRRTVPITKNQDENARFIEDCDIFHHTNGSVCRILHDCWHRAKKAWLNRTSVLAAERVASRISERHFLRQMSVSTQIDRMAAPR